MKQDPRRFAPLGLALAVLALLTFIGLFLVRALSASGVVAALDDKLMERSLWISASVIILGLALTAILDPEGTRKFLTGRQLQYGSNSVIMLLAFTGILVFVNVLAYQNPKSWDLTEDKTNTLAPETVKIISALPQPVEARAYYSPQISRTGVQKLLENFKQNSNGKFTYQFSDPVSNPVAAQQDGVERDGTVVLQMGDRKEPVTAPAEQDLDSALLRLINPQNRVVYFLTGAGEHDLDTPADAAYTLVKSALEKKNYTVKTLNLQSEGKVPQDAKVVVVGGPQVPLADTEVQALDAYLGASGAVIVMEEPLPVTKFGQAADPLATLLTRWGLSMDNDFIVDPNVNPSSFAMADITAYAQHPITNSLRGINSVFPTARSLTLKPAADGLSPVALAVTNANAWGETDFASLQQNNPVFDQNKDLPGPLILAAAVENTATKGRLVAFGDSDFASDALYQRGYGDIFINAVDWAAQQESLIDLTPKQTTQRTFNPPPTVGLIGIILASLCVIPLLIIAGGLAAWYSRRRRG